MATKSACETEHYYVGATIDDRYRLVEFVGVGGMACVYRAMEIGSPHQYAIKFLKTEYHNQPYLIEYFREEAGSMRDLAHPNIVRFYRFVNQDAYSYIIMAFVDGFALSDIIKRMYKRGTEIPLDEVVRIMTQVARALDAIHREGYVHRDIKPSNVLIERNTGQTFLTDLGITTTSNTRMEGAGTLAYMSPEMMKTWIADHRADVYSYGIMFFEMLAKKRPFRVTKGLRGEAAEADLKRKHAEAPIPDITEFRPDLPPELNDIMQKALAKDPEDRYDSIIACAKAIHGALKPRLSDDLQDFANITHRHIDAPEMTAPMQAIQSDERDTRLFYGMLAVGIVAIVLAVVFAGSVLFGNDAPPATDVAIIATDADSANDTPDVTATPNPLAEQPVYALISGVDALAEITGDALVIPPAEDAPLQYLRVGSVEGFQIRMEISDVEAVKRYGAAFRVQDSQNYFAFTYAPERLRWQFIEVSNGDGIVLDFGTIDAQPDELVISGIGSFFEAQLDNQRVTAISDTYPTGSLALYVEGDTDEAQLTLESLEVSLIGDEALAAVESAPTPAAGIADPRRFLRADVSAMLATSDVVNSSIDCPVYIDIYDSLERHLDNTSLEIQDLAQRTIDSGRVVYSRCRAESPNAPLVFLTAIQDYLQWEEDLGEIREALE